MSKILFAFFTGICFFCLCAFTAQPVNANFAFSAASLSKIMDIRVSSNSNKVRIVADANKEVDYETFALSSPDRIVIDIKGAWLASSAKKPLIVNNKNISSIRAAQFSPDTVRIVVNTSLKHDSYDVFSVSGGNVPYRVVMDFGQITSKPRQSSGTAVMPAPATAPAPAAAKPAVSSGPPQVPNVLDRAPIQQPAVITQPAAPVFASGLKGKKIAIDPGHGGNDSGAVGYGGVKEKDSTLRISLKLKKMLEDAGATVIMTRSTDISVAAPTASDAAELQARCDVADKANADIFISIHNDSFTDSSANGTSTYYYSGGSSASKELADDLRSSIIAQVNTPDRGTKTANFYVIKHTDMPAVLIEAAFISNPAESVLLTSDDGTTKFATGIFNGINKFFTS